MKSSICFSCYPYGWKVNSYCLETVLVGGLNLGCRDDPESCSGLSNQQPILRWQNNSVQLTTIARIGTTN